jgi:hypothetical protein
MDAPMKEVLPLKREVAGTSPATETLLLTLDQVEFLQTASQAINPGAHPRFGLPHAVRVLLDYIEESGIDLTVAGSEDEIAALVGGQLENRRRAQRP